MQGRNGSANASVFVSAGEASGDHYIAELSRRLIARGINVWGMGGVESRSCGVDVVWKGEDLQLLGITEVISAIPFVLRRIREITQAIVERAPESVVVCDSPDFNMRLCRALRKNNYNGRIFYISPPSVWAWRRGRIKNLISDFDECLPLFKFEHDYLAEHGATSNWCGHPLLEEFGAESNVKTQCTFDKEHTIAFLPGSRGSEIKTLLPLMKDAARAVEQDGFTPVFSVAPGLNPRIRKEMTEEFKREHITYYEGAGKELLRNSRCSVGASGTITVEALLVNCPMVVTYKVNAFSALVARLFIKTPYYAMANILAGSEIFPELLQERATCGNILSGIKECLNNSKKKEMAEARKKLGSKGAYDFWCDRITGDKNA